jgi:hypothetical protein
VEESVNDGTEMFRMRSSRRSHVNGGFAILWGRSLSTRKYDVRSDFWRETFFGAGQSDGGLFLCIHPMDCD